MKVYHSKAVHLDPSSLIDHGLVKAAGAGRTLSDEDLDGVVSG